MSPGRLGIARIVAILAGVAHIVWPRLQALPQNPDGPTIGIDWSTPVLAAVGATAILGAVLVGRFATIGKMLVTAAAIVSAIGISIEFRPIVLLLALPLVAAVGVMLLPENGESVPSIERPSIESRRAVLGALVLSGFTLWRLISSYTDRNGPTHPESSARKGAWVADWMWLGAVTSTTAHVVAGGLAAGTHSLHYWEQGQPNRRTQTAASSANGIARFELDDLTPGAMVNYAVVAGEATSDVTGEIASESTFRTYERDPEAVRIAFGSCARTGSNGAVFDAIRQTEPDLFVQLGDLHYGNLTSNRPADHLAVLGRSLSTPAQSAMYSSIPSLWIWDDHDFGPNDSDSTSPSRDAVLDAYRQAVPHWGVDPDPSRPINQALSIGGVRVLSTDTRSQRTPDTMLGAEQERWLIGELIESARTHRLVLWANPTPWNFPEIEGSDVWGGFAEERRRIANAIADAGVTNLVMISGDWHLSAIDDGTNTGYADDGSPGFPLIHGAPLDRPGSRTGETYSHGVFSNAGQFGTVDVVALDTSRTEVTLTVHLWTGEELGRYAYTLDSAS